MLSEFEAIERTYGAERASDLRKALHFLLRRQFVFAGDHRTGTIYNVVMDSRFRSVIDGFFDSCGYRVHRDAEAQWAGITAMGEDVPLPRMKLDETIVVLVLAAHWQDEVNVGAVEGRATVVLPTIRPSMTRGTPPSTGTAPSRPRILTPSGDAASVS